MARSGRNPDDYHAQLCIFERHRKDVLSILANQATAHTVVEQAELDLIEQECSKLATLLARVNYLVAIWMSAHVEVPTIPSSSEVHD